MPLLVFRQPIFSIARVLYRPLLGWLGLALTSSSTYNVLWSFAGHVLTNIGFFRGVLLLFSVRRYIFGTISISSLGNIINDYNPILGSIFNTVVRPEIIRIARQSTTTQIGFRRLINIIIINSFLLIFKNVIKFILKYLILIIISLLGVFWFGIFNNFRRLLSLAFDLKDFLDSNILPLGIKIPIPNNITRPSSLWNAIIEGFNYFYTIKYAVPHVPNVPYVRKFNHTGGYSNNNFTSLSENRLLTEDSLLNNTINVSINNHEIVEKTLHLSEFLIHLFNEFNLFC